MKRIDAAKIELKLNSKKVPPRTTTVGSGSPLKKAPKSTVWELNFAEQGVEVLKKLVEEAAFATGITETPAVG